MAHPYEQILVQNESLFKMTSAEESEINQNLKKKKQKSSQNSNQNKKLTWSKFLHGVLKDFLDEIKKSRVSGLCSKLVNYLLSIGVMR